MKLTPITFSAANALFLAQASQAAYLDQGRARPVLPDSSLPLLVRFCCFVRRVRLVSFWNHSRRVYDYR
ncbi:MAG: hypothetical protein DMG85_01970, partial [Acidobacteria bacterium]